MHDRNDPFRRGALLAAFLLAALASGAGCGPSSTGSALDVGAVSTAAPSVAGGSATTGSVTLSALAPAGGATVALASGSSAATVPPTVTIPEGATSATFTISTTPVAADTRATLTATLNGSSRSADLTVAAPVLSSIAVAPTNVQGGSTATGTATISSAAPTGGLAVALDSSSPSASVPASVTVAAGATSATFTVDTQAVASDATATITGRLGSASRTATLTVVVVPAEPVLESVSILPDPVHGGAPATGTVVLSAVALPGGAAVGLASDSPLATVPASVTVPEGAYLATFPVTTAPVYADAAVTVTATLGAASRTTTFTVTPDPCDFLVSGAQWLGFSSNRNGTYDLFAIREDGTCLRQLTQGAGDDLFVTWSRAGLFAFMSPVSGKMQIWLQALTASGASLLDTGDLAATSPAFSPQGSIVAFEGYAPGVTGSSDIYVIPRTGGTPRRLTDGVAYNAGPAWSPDGSTIYFVSNRSGRYDVYRVPADGGAVTAVTASSGILGRPAAAPDGKAIAYCRAAAGAAFSEVVVMDLAPPQAIRVVSSQKDCEPAYDATGQHMAVTSQRSGDPEVLLLDVATGAVVRTLAPSPGIDGLAAFAPFP